MFVDQTALRGLRARFPVLAHVLCPLAFDVAPEIPLWDLWGRLWIVEFIAKEDHRRSVVAFHHFRYLASSPCCLICDSPTYQIAILPSLFDMTTFPAFQSFWLLHALPFLVLFDLDQRAFAAFLAISRRCTAVRLAARAREPLRPRADMRFAMSFCSLRSLFLSMKQTVLPAVLPVKHKSPMFTDRSLL